MSSKDLCFKAQHHETALDEKTAHGSQSSVICQNSSLRELQKRIGRFLYETGTDFSATKASSFQRMINANFGSKGIACAIPSYDDLRGWILLDALNEMQQYVKQIQSSWESTGCSILLDVWADSTGQYILNALVSCPKGTVYIQSAKVSGFDEESDALLKFLENILRAVGMRNVVQIITNSTSASMERVGKKIMEKYNFFWAVCASHCLDLMLEKIGIIKVVREIMNNVKTIARFIHGNATVQELLTEQTCFYDLDRPSEFKFTVPFSILEYMVSEKENLQKLFVSTVWNTSTWAFTTEGKRVTDLVADRSFWTGAIMISKATIPLLRALDIVAKSNEPQVGYIYKNIYDAKQTIIKEFGGEKSAYEPFFNAIDEVWDKFPHRHLYAAGYFLNPKFCYGRDFMTDWKVSTGLYSSVVRLAYHGFQDEINTQIHEYWTAGGAFSLGREQLQYYASPASWWFEYGREYPELQRLAVRILSQTCSGASEYKLKRSLAEKLLAKRMNPIEHKRLADLVFVHYNLQLQNFNLKQCG